MAYRYKMEEWQKPSDFTFDSCFNVAEKWEPSDRRNRDTLVNLVDLLVSKGLVTEAEVIRYIFSASDDFEVAPAPPKPVDYPPPA